MPVAGSYESSLSVFSKGWWIFGKMIISGMSNPICAIIMMLNAILVAYRLIIEGILRVSGFTWRNSRIFAYIMGNGLLMLYSFSIFN